MSIPVELAGYKNEDDFIQRLLIPLLKRLGFSVVNYHGKSEHGRDLIFAEMDRFGHVRYHGLQAKYVPSVGLEAVKEVIDDCDQAFTVPFTHPQTGAEECISTFYAVNGGDFSDQARERYFAALKPHYAGNAKLIDGKALVVLDRWSSINRQQLIGETLVGIRAEIQINRKRMTAFQPKLDEILKDPNRPFPLERFRDEATSSYLVRPTAMDRIPYGVVGGYSDQTRAFNRLLDSCMGLTTVDYKRLVAQTLIQSAPEFEARGKEIEAAVENALADLGPLSGL
jgi:hypothetical protein